MAAGGSRLAVVDTVLDDRCYRHVDNSDSLTLSVPRDAECVTHLRLRRIIRQGTREWRIQDIVDGRGADAELTTTITCVPLVTVLSNCVIREPGTSKTYFNLGGVDASAAELIDQFVLPSLVLDGITWVERGTIDTDEQFNLAWDNYTAMELLQAIATKINCELQFRNNGDTDYRIDLLTERGSDVSPILVRADRNMLSLVRQRRAADLRTVVIPRGAVPDGDEEAATIAHAAFRVSAIAGSVLTLADPAGGADPLRFTDQLLNLYCLRPDGVLTQITDVDVALQQITVASATNIAQGDDIGFRADSNGKLLTELKNPTALTYFNNERIIGRPEDSDVRGERNHIKNSGMATWPTNGDVKYGNFTNTVTSTTVALKNLEVGLVVAAGDVLFYGTVQVAHITAGGTADGSGNLSVTTSLSVGQTANAAIAILRTFEPTGWTASGTWFPRRTLNVAGGNITGTRSGSGASDQLDLTGMTVGAVIQPGDVVGTSASNRALVLVGGTVDGSGNVTLRLASSPNYSGTVTVYRPSFTSVEGGAYGALSYTTGTPNGYMRSPAIGVRYAADMGMVWAHVRFALWTFATDTGGGPLVVEDGGTIHPAVLEIIDADSSTVLATKTDDDSAMLQGDVVEVTLRVSYQLDQTRNLAIRFYPTHRTQLNVSDPVTCMMWSMLTVGSDPAVPWIDGSHANGLWHLGNRTLADAAPDDGEPVSFAMSMADLSRMMDSLSDEELQIGAPVTVMDTELGVDTDLRIMALTESESDPTATQVTLARLSPRLTKRLTSRRQRLTLQVNIEDARRTTSTIQRRATDDAGEVTYESTITDTGGGTTSLDAATNVRTSTDVIGTTPVEVEGAVRAVRDAEGVLQVVQFSHAGSKVLA
jgi:hypothetical protein